MIFCPKCGAQLDDNAEFCTKCGANVKANAAAPAAAPAPAFNQSDKTSEFDPQDIQNNKVMAVLAYFSWLVLVPIFGARESKFAKFHANQGILIAIGEIIWNIVWGIIVGVIGASSYGFGVFSAGFAIVTALMWLGNLVFFIFSVLGIVSAAQGTAKELPLIGKIKIIK